MTEQSSCHKQISTRLRRFRPLSWKDARPLDGSSVSRAIRFFMESTESLLSSIGMFSQGTMHRSCSYGLQSKWQHAESNEKISEIGSSSCRCTVTSIGREVKKTSINVFRILRNLGITHTDSRRDIGLFSVREMQKNGIELIRASLKESGTDQQR